VYKVFYADRKEVKELEMRITITAAMQQNAEYLKTAIAITRKATLFVWMTDENKSNSQSKSQASLDQFLGRSQIVTRLMFNEPKHTLWFYRKWKTINNTTL